MIDKQRLLSFFKVVILILVLGIGIVFIPITVSRYQTEGIGNIDSNIAFYLLREGYYQENVKPKPETEGKKGYVCKVCGYVYEGDELPDDYVCPLCKHGAADFEPIK